MSVLLKDFYIRRKAFELGPLNVEFADRGLHLVRGRNGTGKTSLLKALLGRAPVQKNSAVSGLIRPIGSVGIEPLFFESWSLRRNLSWFSKLLRMKADDSAIAFVQKWADRPVEELSQGMKRAAELSFLLAIPFPTLFLDEPFNHLDSEAKCHFENALSERSQHSFILMSLHPQMDIPKSVKGVLDL